MRPFTFHGTPSAGPYRPANRPRNHANRPPNHSKRPFRVADSRTLRPLLIAIIGGSTIYPVAVAGVPPGHQVPERVITRAADELADSRVRLENVLRLDESARADGLRSLVREGTGTVAVLAARTLIDDGTIEAAPLIAAESGDITESCGWRFEEGGVPSVWIF